MLPNFAKARAILSLIASCKTPVSSHLPGLLAATTLRNGACSPVGKGLGPGAICAEATTPRCSSSARTGGAK